MLIESYFPIVKKNVKDIFAPYSNILIYSLLSISKQKLFKLINKFIKFNEWNLNQDRVGTFNFSTDLYNYFSLFSL